MNLLTVDSSTGTLNAFGVSMTCSIGRSGACLAWDKREGDGMTPIGDWPIRGVVLRRDRVMLSAALSLPWRWIGRTDGWSDDVADPAYNRPVTHPHPFSAEWLWRDDGLYDAIAILGHNDAPPVPGAGSAIFLHCCDGTKPTEGCVAIEKDALLELLPKLSPGDMLAVR